MFKVVVNSHSDKFQKKTIASNILESAWDEIDVIALENHISRSNVVSQMIYECLGRDKITGLVEKSK